MKEMKKMEENQPGSQKTIEDTRAQILVDVLEERARQVNKFGIQRLEDGGLPQDERLMNDAKEIVRLAVKHGCLTWRMVLREEVFEAFDARNLDELREELVQVMATAMAWIEDVEERIVARDACGEIYY